MQRSRVVFAALGATHVVSGLVPHPIARRINRATKPLLMPTLGLSSAGAAPGVRVALTASTVGDTALMWDTPTGILGGIIGFGAAHTAYLGELVALGRGAGARTTGRISAAAAVVTVTAAAVLRRTLTSAEERGLLVPAIGYAGMCATMGAAAFRAGTVVGGRRGRALKVGGVFFVISDSLVAAGLFGPIQWHRFGLLSAAIMITYLIAQACLVTGLTPDEARRPNPEDQSTPHVTG